MPTALIVDDESEARELLVFNLANGGWRTIEAGDGFAALRLARAELPDVVILDLMLPEMSGEAVFYRLRHHPATQHIPVIMLTAKGAPQHREAGLEMGAEDYVTKPYSPRELAIRLERLLKQKHACLAAANHLEAGPFRLDRSSLTFYLNNTALDLTGTEFRLLMTLLDSPGKDLLRSELLQRIWGYDERIQTRTLDTHVKRLREKLGAYGDRIETVRGIGYRLRAR